MILLNKLNKLYLFCGLMSLPLALCAADLPVDSTASTSPLKAAQDTVSFEKTRQLNLGKNVKIRILQLGDSHTAGGYFTDGLRETLQAAWGDGGVGLAYPNSLKYQRNPIQYTPNNSWQIVRSRQQNHDTPMGGIFTRSPNPSENGIEFAAHLTWSLPPTTSSSSSSSSWFKQPVYLDSLMVRARSQSNVVNPLELLDGMGQIHKIQPEKTNTWQNIPLHIPLPVRVVSPTDKPNPESSWDLGWLNLENEQNKGVTVSALGINGAQFLHSTLWRDGWQNELTAAKTDWLILAFGANESLQPYLDIADTEKNWINQINTLRQAQPEMTIVILGAPETLKSRDSADGCGVRAPRLDEIQAMQMRVAEQTQTQYWSIQTAMGGKCTMNQWVEQKLAQKDGVHFTADGYKKLGRQFAQQIIDWLK